MNSARCFHDFNKRVLARQQIVFGLVVARISLSRNISRRKNDATPVYEILNALCHSGTMQLGSRPAASALARLAAQGYFGGRGSILAQPTITTF